MKVSIISLCHSVSSSQLCFTLSLGLLGETTQDKSTRSKKSTKFSLPTLNKKKTRHEMHKKVFPTATTTSSNLSFDQPSIPPLLFRKTNQQQGSKGQ